MTNVVGEKLYLYQPGFVEDSVIYELVPREVARLKEATLEEVGHKLDELGIHKIVIDTSYPDVIERMKTRRHIKKLIRLRPLYPLKGNSK